MRQRHAEAAFARKQLEFQRDRGPPLRRHRVDRLRDAEARLQRARNAHQRILQLLLEFLQPPTAERPQHEPRHGEDQPRRDKADHDPRDPRAVAQHRRQKAHHDQHRGAQREAQVEHPPRGDLQQHVVELHGGLLQKTVAVARRNEAHEVEDNVSRERHGGHRQQGREERMGEQVHGRSSSASGVKMSRSSGRFARSISSRKVGMLPVATKCPSWREPSSLQPVCR